MSDTVLIQDFSHGQREALEKVSRWLDDPTREQVFRLFGYAGTGKTTIAKALAAQMDGTVAFMAYTGKASLVMQRNGCFGASTIHSSIYSVKQHRDGSITFHLNPDGAAACADLIVVDECSMVDDQLAMDLLSFGTPILVLGDPAQLPPVNGEGYFTNARPDAMLTEIHRQAAGNPIIKAATAVREGKPLSHGDWGEGRLRILPRGSLDAEYLLGADQVICGLNATRTAYNQRLRAALGRTGWEPQVDDRVICLKNRHDEGLMNGGMFQVREVAREKARGANSKFAKFTQPRERFKMKVQSLDFDERAAQPVSVLTEFFQGGWKDIDWRILRTSHQFEYGYTITCHKAQGSQFGHVVLYDEGQVFGDDYAKWLYTGVTRAADRLTLVM